MDKLDRPPRLGRAIELASGIILLLFLQAVATYAWYARPRNQHLTPGVVSQRLGEGISAEEARRRLGLSEGWWSANTALSGTGDGGYLVTVSDPGWMALYTWTPHLYLGFGADHRLRLADVEWCYLTDDRHEWLDLHGQR